MAIKTPNQLYLPSKEYFEGILQLRNVTDDLVQWVYTQTAKDARALITADTRVRGGYDLKFSSQKYLRIIGRKIKERFPGQITESRTLHTQSRTGEDLYRVTVAFRQLPFKEGDIVRINNKEHKVLRLRDKAEVEDITTKKKRWLRFEDIGMRKRDGASRF